MNSKDVLKGGVRLGLALTLSLSRPELVQAAAPSKRVCDPVWIELASYNDEERGSCRVGRLAEDEGLNLYLGGSDSYDILIFSYYDDGNGVPFLYVSLTSFNYLLDWGVSSDVPQVGETVEMVLPGVVSVRITGLEDGGFLVSYTKVKIPVEGGNRPYFPYYGPYGKQHDA